ncbi:hypothetical protein U0070_000364 [Myodes glareolus]|uniref:Uncharacterized protein n=1 Tax=Myodes glareolus TaxID=447135 RepID=A0AAW0H828_MYOGA
MPEEISFKCPLTSTPQTQQGGFSEGFQSPMAVMDLKTLLQASRVPKVAGSPLDLHPRPAIPPLWPRSLEWGGPWGTLAKACWRLDLA